MTLIVKPFTFTAGTKAKASEVNSDFDTVYTAFNGAIGEANVTWVVATDGIRAWRAGPNAGGTNGRRFSVVSRAVTLTGGANSGTQAYVFSTDAVDGNPSFSVAPTVFGIAMLSNTNGPDLDMPLVWVRPDSITTTGLTLIWDRSYTGATTNNQSITVTIGLVGNV